MRDGEEEQEGNSETSDMTDPSANNVIVGTRFSRLRKIAAVHGPPPQVDLAYEALAALSEVMDVLAEMLAAKAEGRSVSDARRLRIAERAELLVEQVRRLSATDESAAKADALETASPAAAEPEPPDS
jgi:hypothetical protein